MNHEIAHLAYVALANESPQHVGAVVTVGRLVKGLLAEVVAMALDEGGRLAGGRTRSRRLWRRLLLGLRLLGLLLRPGRRSARDEAQIELRTQGLDVVDGVRLRDGLLLLEQRARRRGDPLLLGVALGARGTGAWARVSLVQ